MTCTEPEGSRTAARARGSERQVHGSGQVARRQHRRAGGRTRQPGGAGAAHRALSCGAGLRAQARRNTEHAGDYCKGSALASQRPRGNAGHGGTAALIPLSVRSEFGCV